MCNVPQVSSVQVLTRHHIATHCYFLTGRANNVNYKILTRLLAWVLPLLFSAELIWAVIKDTENFETVELEADFSCGVLGSSVLLCRPVSSHVTARRCAHAQLFNLSLSRPFVLRGWCWSKSAKIRPFSALCRQIRVTFGKNYFKELIKITM